MLFVLFVCLSVGKESDRKVGKITTTKKINEYFMILMAKSIHFIHGKRSVMHFTKQYAIYAQGIKWCIIAH